MAIGNKTDAQILELKEAQMKTDAQQNRTDVKLKETIKEFRAAQKLLGDMGLVQGEVADDKKNCPASRLCCRSTRTARYWPELARWW
jgi:hypothetical protein